MKLTKISPNSHPDSKDKNTALRKTVDLQEKIYDLLYLMYAHNRYSMLIILHGIDTSGKDGTVKHIFSCANPQGMRVYSFKEPSDEELKHDFLWRCHVQTPPSGVTTIFNRSYYEDVTTTMVHPKLLEKQNIPDELLKQKDFFKERYKRINDFEKMLTQKGTVVLKFFLHISKDEQKARLKDRLVNRNKNWKFSPSDIKNRKFWDEYMESFDKMIKHTDTKHAPWTIVPANHKWYRDYIVSQTIYEALKKLKMSFPKSSC